jgi:hypothetical protein
VTLIPYLKAGSELALDLSARQRIENYLRRAEEALAGDDTVLLVIAEEDRARKAGTSIPLVQMVNGPGPVPGGEYGYE